MFKVIPGLTMRDFKIFKEWISEEERLKQKCIINYKDPKSGRSDQFLKREVNFTQVKDFLFIFTMLDKKNEGLLTLGDLKRLFAKSHSEAQIEELFKKYDYNGSERMNVEEFLHMMVPSDYNIS